MELPDLPNQALGTLYSRAEDGSLEAQKLATWLMVYKNLKLPEQYYTPACTKRANFIKKVIDSVLAKKPNAIIFTIGCGFSTYYQELVNPQCYWMDTDLVENTRLKSEYFKNTKNYKCFPLDANKLKISDKELNSYGVIFSQAPDLIIMEGVLMYLDKEKAKDLLTSHNIPTVFDVLGHWRNKPLGEWHKWQYKYNEFNLNITDAKMFDNADSWIYNMNGDK